MKNSSNLFIQKVISTIKAHFTKNPNDLIALSFGIFVLAFIILITPQIPQKASSTLAVQPAVEQELNKPTDANLHNHSSRVNEKVILKATLK